MTERRMWARAEAAGDHDETSSIRSLFFEEAEPAVEREPALQAMVATHGPPPGPFGNTLAERVTWIENWRTRYVAAIQNE